MPLSALGWTLGMLLTLASLPSNTFRLHATPNSAAHLIGGIPEFAHISGLFETFFIAYSWKPSLMHNCLDLPEIFLHSGLLFIRSWLPCNSPLVILMVILHMCSTTEHEKSQEPVHSKVFYQNKNDGQRMKIQSVRQLWLMVFRVARDIGVGGEGGGGGGGFMIWLVKSSAFSSEWKTGGEIVKGEVLVSS